jgi:hypothetical protein
MMRLKSRRDAGSRTVEIENVITGGNDVAASDAEQQTDLTITRLSIEPHGAISPWPGRPSVAHQWVGPATGDRR